MELANIETYGINIIAIIPQSAILVMSFLSIYAMHIGDYQPASRVWQGVGGAIYIFGFAMYVAFDPMQFDQIGRGIMWVGVTVNFIPRFMITSGDFKWMVKNRGVKGALKQLVTLKSRKRFQGK